MKKRGGRAASNIGRKVRDSMRNEEGRRKSGKQHREEGER
jgi:hypothetical protein